VTTGDDGTGCECAGVGPTTDRPGACGCHWPSNQNRPWQPPPRLVGEFFANNTHILEHPGLFLFGPGAAAHIMSKKRPDRSFCPARFSTGTGRRDDQSSRRLNHQEKSNRHRDAFFIEGMDPFPTLRLACHVVSVTSRGRPRSKRSDSGGQSAD
jgi:hypothetical protein